MPLIIAAAAAAAADDDDDELGNTYNYLNIGTRCYGWAWKFLKKIVCGILHIQLKLYV